jgi:hypothetical protein
MQGSQIKFWKRQQDPVKKVTTKGKCDKKFLKQVEFLGTLG